jgi:hypothetical protein
MGGEGSQIDFWDVLDDAEQTVERWPSWQKDVEADVYYEDELLSVESVALRNGRELA